MIRVKSEFYGLGSVEAANQKPGRDQIRDSNNYTIAGYATLAGAAVRRLPLAVDDTEELKKQITEAAAQSDVLITSGGVSMGKYDLVETVLKDLGAEFYFDAVAIRPGKPTVFGKCKDRFIFGLPGNPVSTMITFELFVSPALDILAGAAHVLPVPDEPQDLPPDRRREGVEDSLHVPHGGASVASFAR